MLRTSLLILFVLTTFFTIAQKPTKPVVKNAAVKGFKPPKLTCSLGNYKDSATITVAEGQQLITTPLKITDAKNGKYIISSYQFLYRKTGVTEEENEDGPTGKTKPSTTISADLFKTTPLPQLWITNINDQLKTGDELFFFDVIVKDEQGRLMFAPTLKLKVR
jgi:hypothetical protein